MSNSTFSNYETKPLTAEDLGKAIAMIESFPPAPIEIRMSQHCMDLIRKTFPTTQRDLVCSTMCGIKVVESGLSDGIAANQGKIIYRDGSSKIIEIYKVREDTNANKRAD